MSTTAAPATGFDVEGDQTTTTQLQAVETIPSDADFFEDFSSGTSMARFEFGMFHRDECCVRESEWQGDHQSTGPGDLCGPPEEKRQISRGDRDTGFNEDWHYRCVPGGDLGKAHMMTSIGDTSAYSIGAFTPTRVFNSVREVRWDVNLTDLGTRQFVEVKIIPEQAFDFQRMPCTQDVPCNTPRPGELGAVTASFASHQLRVHNGSEMTTSHMDFVRDFPTDPALSSIRIRRTQVLRDNQNGTLTYEVEREDGSFESFTTPGRFPQGPVRVVFADHNYTPLKDGPVLGFTWHWDNIEVLQNSGDAAS